MKTTGFESPAAIIHSTVGRVTSRHVTHRRNTRHVTSPAKHASHSAPNSNSNSIRYCNRQRRSDLFPIEASLDPFAGLSTSRWTERGRDEGRKFARRVLKSASPKVTSARETASPAKFNSTNICDRTRAITCCTDRRHALIAVQAK